MLRTTTTLAILALLLHAPTAGAVSEQGDAGDLPATAQDLTAANVVHIDGGFSAPNDFDVYKVCLPGGRTFSASTVGGSAVDTQLFLFDANGRGVYGNDDAAGSQSELPAGHALTPQAPGEYYLAITSYNWDPRSDGGAIFPALPNMSQYGSVLAPNGPGASEPVNGWFGRAGQAGSYRISVTGATCSAPDTTPPAVDLRSPRNRVEVPRGAGIEVDYSCADEPGGSGLASCVGNVADGAMLDTSTPGSVSVTVTARDNAGNSASVTHTVVVVDRDTTAPTLDLRSPLDGAVYLLDQEVVADYSCADEPGGSGMAGCAGTVADGAAVDTGSVGEKTFSVQATDGAGNTAVGRSVYRVVYDFEGFLWPVRNRPRVTRWQAGVPVPIRFELGGDRGLEVIEQGWPKVAEIPCGSQAEPTGGETARHPRWFRELAYSKRRQRYLSVWKTERGWAGSCRQFMLRLNDGTTKRADFQFSRRWHP